MKITIEDENSLLTLRRSADNLEDVLTMLEDALRGVGFVFKGQLSIINDEE